MSTRKIKDAKDLETDEKIYFKGHAKATYLSDGRNVEDAINSIDTGSEVQKTTEAEILAMGFTKNTGTYSKPSTGIPKTDLASAVQTSLGKADTSVQSVTINGTTKSPTNGVVDLGSTQYPVLTSSSSSISMNPNTYYRVAQSLSNLTISFKSATDNTIVNEYLIEFLCGGTVSIPDTIVWANGKVPTFEVGKTYLLSVVNNLGLVAKFD